MRKLRLRFSPRSSKTRWPPKPAVRLWIRHGRRGSQGSHRDKRLSRHNRPHCIRPLSRRSFRRNCLALVQTGARTTTRKASRAVHTYAHSRAGKERAMTKRQTRAQNRNGCKEPSEWHGSGLPRRDARRTRNGPRPRPRLPNGNSSGNKHCRTRQRKQQCHLHNYPCPDLPRPP